ncbi:MAG: hypothetical protein V1789_06595 [PVC group bacterium]
MKTEPVYFFSPAEWSAIYVHKYYLAQKAGVEVSLQDTIADWLKNYARLWREQEEEIKKQTGKYSPEGEQFSPAEWKGIQVHRYFLSQRYCRWVSIQETIADWLKNYARIWREKRMELSSRNQMEQILKHKWLESEKVRHDVGQKAAADWIEKFAKQWRLWWETE